MTEQWRQKEDGRWEPVPTPKAASQPDPDYEPLDLPKQVEHFQGLDLRDRSVTNTGIAYHMWTQFSQAHTHVDRVAALQRYLYDAWVNGNTEYAPDWRLNQEIGRFIGANYKEIGINLETHRRDHEDHRAATSHLMQGFREQQPFWQKALHTSWTTFSILFVPWLGIYMYLSMFAGALPFGLGAYIINAIVLAATSLVIGTTITLVKSGSQSSSRSSGRNTNSNFKFNFVRFIQVGVMLCATMIFIAQWGIAGAFYLFMVWGADFILIGLILTMLHAIGITNTRNFGTFFTAAICIVIGLYVGSKDAAGLAYFLAIVGLIAGGVLGSLAGELAYNCVNNNGATNTPPTPRRRR